jgi:hypothetical protein
MVTTYMGQNNDKQQTTETLAYGMTRRWVDDDQIAIVKTQGDMSHAAIDAWADMLIEMLTDWPAGQDIAFLHDLRAPAQGLSPYARRRVMDILAAIPDDRPTYTAILLPHTFVNRIIMMFVRTRPFRQKQHDVRVFNTQEDALAWLRERLHQARSG